jgi:hypothetical protein
MSTMTMPGFTAEPSVNVIAGSYASTGCYHTSASEAVQPQSLIIIEHCKDGECISFVGNCDEGGCTWQKVGGLTRM